jgi:hypothetical protein
VAVIVSQAGIRMHATGEPSEIVPVTAKLLTIPAVPEAYGRRAREFSNLRIAYRRKNGQVQAFALVQAEDSGLTVRQTGGRGKRLPKTIGGQGRVIYWLVDRVRTSKYEGVVPSDDEIRTEAVAVVKGLVSKAYGGSDPPDGEDPSPNPAPKE